MEYPSSLLLFDSGTRYDVKLILNFITKKLYRKPSDLKLVFVSHMHPDHSGGARQLKKLTGCKIAAAENANDWYDGLGGTVEHGIDIFLTCYVATRKRKKIQNIIFNKKIPIDYHLKDGDLLPGFSDWQVIGAHGHTHCDLNILHASKEYFYVADNIVKTFKGYVPPYPMYNPENYLKVLDHYLEMDFKNYLLAHGGKIVKEKVPLDKIKERVGNSPRTHMGYVKYKLSRLKREDNE